MLVFLNRDLEAIADAVLELIPTGAEKAIQAKEIENQLEINHSFFKIALKYLREKGCVICSGTSRPGYFKPSCATDAEQYVRDERHRITSLCRALRAAELYVGDVPFLDKLTGGQGVES